KSHFSLPLTRAAIARPMEDFSGLVRRARGDPYSAPITNTIRSIEYSLVSGNRTIAASGAACYENARMGRMKLALCLPGGGVTGGMYQVGALSALEDALEGLDARGFDLYIGTSSGATVAAALAGGLPVQRLYRALLDPADNYFPLERSHLVRTDLDEWRRTIVTAFGALRSGVQSLTSRAPAAKDLWEQLDRFYDSLPAGLFTLDAFERFLEEFFLRRGVSTGFPGLQRPLRVVAHDLDSGDRMLFGAPSYDDIPVARACCAST